jgi:tetratricopeptide (TPR) repeat protein
VASVNNGEVRVRGDETHPANDGRLCVKGSALGETTGLEGRLLRPMIDDREVEWSQALEAAEQAAAYAGTPPLPTLDALAAAYAEVGRFEDAVGAARQALSLARSANAAAQVEALDARLQLYEQQRPYREPTP